MRSKPKARKQAPISASVASGSGRSPSSRTSAGIAAVDVLGLVPRAASPARPSSRPDLGAGDAADRLVVDLGQAAGVDRSGSARRARRRRRGRGRCRRGRRGARRSRPGRSVQEEWVSAWLRRSSGSSAISVRQRGDGRSGSAPRLRPARARATKPTASPTVSILRRLLLGDGDPVAVLELHHQLVEVERVGVEVLLEAGPLVDPRRRRPRAPRRGARGPGSALRRGSSARVPITRRPSLGSGGERAAAGAALAQQRRGAPDRVDLDAAGGEADRVGDALGAGAAVADDGDPAQAEQDRAAGRVGVRARGAGRRAPGASAGRRARRAGWSGRRRGSRRRPSRAVPSISFSATLPVKPSVTTTSAAAGGQVAALDVAGEVDPRRLGEQARGPRPPPRGPCPPPRRPRAGRPRGRSTPSTASLKAAPRKANWTRCWARTSTLAPTSRKSTGLPGTGSWTASAGRCTPLQAAQAEGRGGHRRPGRAGADHRRRRRPRRRRRRRAPPRPPAWRAPRAPGPPRCRSTPRSGRPRSPRRRRGRARSGGPKTRTPIPSAAASAGALGEHLEALLGPEAVEGDGHAAPGRHYSSASGAAARRLGDRVRDHLTAGVGAAGRADPVRQARAVAARAAVEARPCRPCAWRAACRGGRWKFSSSGRPSVAAW